MPLLCAIYIAVAPTSNTIGLKQLSLTWSLLVLNFCILLFFGFDTTNASFQFVNRYNWFGIFNFNINLGVDSISLCMILLTAFLVPSCILLCWSYSVNRHVKTYLIAFLSLESILFGVFCSLDLLVFYILFEAVLIPMFVIVGIFGSKQRRSRAAYLLFFYTLTSSVLILLCII